MDERLRKLRTVKQQVLVYQSLARSRVVSRAMESADADAAIDKMHQAALELYEVMRRGGTA